MHSVHERYLDDVNIKSKVRMLAAGGRQIKLLFTAPNFLKHFIDFWEKTLWNDSAMWQSVRGGAVFRITAYLITTKVAQKVMKYNIQYDRRGKDRQQAPH